MRIFISAVLLTAAVQSAFAADMAVPSRIDAVTVFPQGAEVTRVAKVTLEQGAHTVTVADLPRDAIASSIRVEGLATGKLEIGSVDSRRLTVSRTGQDAASGERRRIEDELELLADQKSVLEAQLKAAETQKMLIANMAGLPSRPAPQQGAERPEDWTAVLSTIASASAEAQRNELDARVKLRALDRQIDDLQKKRDTLAPAEEERTQVRVHLEAMAALEADIVIGYQVTNALWTPRYDARLSTGDKMVAPVLTLSRHADIRQTTGEPWENVTLMLSTTRPNAGATVPALASVTVDFEEALFPRRVAAAPAPPEGAARDGMSMLGAETPPAKAVADTPALMEITQRAADATGATFQANFKVPGRSMTANTGEAKRVQLLSQQIEPVLSVKAVPKSDTNAYLYAKTVLPEGSPLPPGPVCLFRDGTFAGTGRLPLLSPGESHEIGFGVDDLVRVKHALVAEKRGETGLIATSRTDVRNFSLTVKNMHERPIAVTVMDQVPVSANQDIKVEITGKTPPLRTDVDGTRGVLAWDLKLEPDQEEIIDFGYRVVWPAARSVAYR